MHSSLRPSAILCVLCVLHCVSKDACRANEFEFFETRIRPMLVKHCYECHSTGSAKLQGGLLLDHREGLRKGGESGPAVVRPGGCH